MHQTKKDLVIISNGFPFGTGETFLDNEMPYLHKAFKKIIIVARTKNPVLKRQIPEDIDVLLLPPTSNTSTKIKTLLSIFKSLVFVLRIMYNEWISVKTYNTYEPCKKVFKTMWHDLVKSMEIRNFLSLNVLPKIGDNSVLYSYWQNNAAFSLAMIKLDNPDYFAISRAHRVDLYFDSQYNNYLSFRSFISQNLNRVFFISENGMNYQKELLSTRFDSFSISKLGTEKINELLEKKRAKPYVVVSCSSLIRVKRVHLIVEALAQIDDIEISWIHYGDGLLRQDIGKLLESVLDKKTNIKYQLKGFTPNIEIHNFYAKNEVDLFLNVSESEGIPVSIMEAMSYGIPVIATDVGGTSEIVNSDVGILVNKAVDQNELAKLISKELLSIELKTKSQKAFEKWNSEYNAFRNYSSFVMEF